MVDLSSDERAMRFHDFARLAKTLSDVAEVMSRRQLLELADVLYSRARDVRPSEPRAFGRKDDAR